MIRMHGKLTEKFSERGRKERNEFAKLENGKKKKRKGMNINLKFLFEAREPIFPLETF